MQWVCHYCCEESETSVLAQPVTGSGEKRVSAQISTPESTQPITYMQMCTAQVSLKQPVFNLQKRFYSYLQMCKYLQYFIVRFEILCGRLADENKGMSLQSETWLFQRHLSHLCIWRDGLCWLWQVDLRSLSAVKDIWSKSALMVAEVLQFLYFKVNRLCLSLKLTICCIY